MKRLFTLVMIFVAWVAFSGVGKAEDANPVYTSWDYDYTINTEGNAVIAQYNGTEASVYVPAALGGYAVDGIGDMAFLGCNTLKYLELPDNLQSIGVSAFAFTPLESISFSGDLLSIGSAAFSGCEELESINLPDSLTSIGDYAFSGCLSLQSFRLPDGLQSIGDYAFFQCPSLTSIRLPDSVVTIGENPFLECEALACVHLTPGNPVFVSIDGVLGRWEDMALLVYPAGKAAETYDVPQGTQVIGVRAFYGCNSLTKVNLPDSLQSIGDAAFVKCDSLTAITVSPDNSNFVSIDGVLFHAEDRALVAYPAGKTETEYSVPENTLSVGDHAFCSCSALRSVRLPEGLQSVGNSAFGFCEALQSVSLPASVQSIGDKAFTFCETLASVNLPDNLQSIGYSAFSYCSALSSINLPVSIQYIGNGAFRGCDALTLTVAQGSYAHQYAADNGIPFEFAGGSAADATGQEYTSGNYKYALDAEGNAAITAYLGQNDEESITVPTELDGHFVTGIGEDVFTASGHSGPSAFPTPLRISAHTRWVNAIPLHPLPCRPACSRLDTMHFWDVRLMPSAYPPVLSI
ncbi:MAG: leucine-rich repeat domain-containing protein [Clostridiales bacterium]|nr:leucine-rich repeat domain-containing protein [Clostridiales bacterium]